MSSSENPLSQSSKNVFAKPFLDDASLLDSVSLLGVNQSSSQTPATPAAPIDPLTKPVEIQALAETKSTTQLPLTDGTIFSTPQVASSASQQLGLDPITGNPIVPQAQAARTASVAMTPQSVSSSNSATLPKFTILAEGTFTVNGNSDFDGDALNPTDDALIYAGTGFSISGNNTLPVRRDANGSIIRDASGNPILVDYAVTVGQGYTLSRATGNQYAGLIPPPVIPRQTIFVPAYADIRSQELGRRIPNGAPTVTFNSAQNSVNNASDWNRRFPASGTTTQPTVVRVTNGGLTIPNNVTLRNTIIMVDSGNINFNGSNHILENVVLVTNNGTVNLSNVQSTNLSVLSSGSITMSGGARFSGSTLLANHSGDISFNGATKDLASTNHMKVVSQGDITFNGAADTRGAFLTAGNYTSNGSSSLHGVIGAKGNVQFNGRATVVGVANLELGSEPPVVTAGLARDTAPNNTTNTDRITFDPTIQGSITLTGWGIQVGASAGNTNGNLSVTDQNQVVTFRAGFNTTPTTGYVDIRSSLTANGSFTLTRSQLDTIFGRSIPDGQHTLHLQATDKYGNSGSFAINFTLDSQTGAPNLSLATTSDSGSSSADRITRINTPTITGMAEAGARIQLLNNGQVIGETIAATNGAWQVVTSQLADGTHTLTGVATDIAGNVSAVSSPLTLVVDTAPPQVSLTTLLTAPLTSNTQLAGIANGTGSPVTSLRYRFNSGAEIAVNLTSGGEFSQALDFTGLSNGLQTLSLTTIDIAGNVRTQAYTVEIALDNEAPVIQAELVRDTAPHGTTNTDRITFDPTISGSLTDASAIASFWARLNTTSNFVNILPQRQADGRFTLSRAQLEQVFGASLPDGGHTLQLQAEDEFGQRSGVFNLAFILDTTILPPSNLQLAPSSDSGSSSQDGITRINTPVITGRAEPGATVQLYSGVVPFCKGWIK
jgi:hypothetical protein